MPVGCEPDRDDDRQLWRVLWSFALGPCVRAAVIVNGRQWIVELQNRAFEACEGIFMHRIGREQFEPQVREPFEITIERAQHRAVFDCNGSQVCVADEIAATAGAHQQSPQNRRVAVGRRKDTCMGMGKPFVHETKCVFNLQWVGDVKWTGQCAVFPCSASRSSVAICPSNRPA